MENSKNNQRMKKIATVFLLVATIGVLVFLGLFVLKRVRYAVTDAVFIRSDTIVHLGFDNVSGRLIEVRKIEGDPVKKGEVIARIDPTPYEERLRGLRARLLSEEHRLGELGLKLKRIKKELLQGERISREKVLELEKKKDALMSRERALKAVLDDIQRDKGRYERLFKDGVVSRKRFELVSTKYEAKKNELNALKKELKALDAAISGAKEALLLSRIKRARTGEIEESIKALEQSIRALKAQIALAERDIEECVLKSPIDGRVAKRYMAPGDMVLPGKVVMSLVDPKDIYVLVLLEEGKLRGVKKGAPCTIHIDAYPGEKFKGVVEAVLPASAATFALIPRDVSAGEFTKVAQRIPVRIRIEEGDTSLLTIGLGGEVEIKRI